MASTPGVTVSDDRVVQVRDNHQAPALILGPLDRLALGWLPISVVFSYAEIVDCDRLERALTATLCHYPALIGELVAVPDGEPRIEQRGSSIRYRIADCDGDIHSFLSETSSLDAFPDSGSSLLLPLDRALFNIQLTRFRTGSTVAMRISHIVTDAAGLTQFALDLSKAYREIGEGRLPHFEASIIKPHIPPVGSIPPDGPAPQMYSTAMPKHGPRSSNVQTKVIRLAKDFLVELKQRAQPQHGWVSTFDALAAHLYQSIHRARVSTGAVLSPQDYFTAVNVRSHLELPDRYFPMTTLDPYFSFESDTLLNAPLFEVAAMMHDINRSLSPDQVKETVRWLQAHPDSHHRFRFGNGCLMTTKWSGFDLYRTRLGTDPIRVSLPMDQAAAVDGLVYLMPTETDGAIDLYLSLDVDVWRQLGDGSRLRELGPQVA